MRSPINVLTPNAHEPDWGNITKYSDGRFSASRKRLSASSLSHIARYALSFTYKTPLPIRHKSPHRNYWPHKRFARQTGVLWLYPLSAENNMKNISEVKALSCSALVMLRENFLKNNCENIWWEWEKYVILHSLNGTSGTPLTTPPSKEIYKILT